MDYKDFYLATIELDLQRTLSKATPEIIDKMRNVLKVYARRNPSMGYCQGLNFIAAFILQCEFSEEETFWLLSVIIEEILPIDYYTSMIGALVDQKVFQDLLRAHNPKVCEKIE